MSTSGLGHTSGPIALPALSHATTAGLQQPPSGQTRDLKQARVVLRTVGIIEQALQWGHFKGRVTCVSVVGQEIIVAVHGEQSKVFGLKEDEDTEVDDMRDSSPWSRVSSWSNLHSDALHAGVAAGSGGSIEIRGRYSGSQEAAHS